MFIINLDVSDQAAHIPTKLDKIKCSGRERALLFISKIEGEYLQPVLVHVDMM